MYPCFVVILVKMNVTLTNIVSCLTLVGLCVCVVTSGDSQLLINVRNQGGDVVQETITSNISEDTVILEFQRSDGTLVTQLVDFRNDVQILKILVLGEEERGQSQYQVMCFVCHLSHSDFIAADAMAKLRQKNPGTVRVAEEDRGRDNLTLDHWLLIDRASPTPTTVLSAHVRTLCAEAHQSTYVRVEDVKLWATLPGASELSIMSSLKKFPSSSPESNSIAETIPRCSETFKMWQPCQCHLEICIGWYPCGLKYCKGKGENKNLMTYRCGIKTCKKCYLFSYYVGQKQMCLWDE